MIEVKHVYHDYGGKGKFAVSDISFAVESGHIFGFLGPSGAGKSTVQNIMTGLLPLQRGEVLYDGQSVKALKTKFFNQIGVSFEQPNVYARLTGYENLKYFAALFSVPTRSDGAAGQGGTERCRAQESVGVFQGDAAKAHAGQGTAEQAEISVSGRTDQRA